MTIRAAFVSAVSPVVALVLGSALVGCTTRPPFLPNSDPALRQTSAQFAADAAHRHYEADAPKGGDANGRAEVDYGIHRLTIVNSSTEDWNNIEIWVTKAGKKYVVSLPKILGNAALTEQVNFQSIFDEHGSFVPYTSDMPIDSVEMFKDGKMYTLHLQLAD